MLPLKSDQKLAIVLLSAVACRLNVFTVDGTSAEDSTFSAKINPDFHEIGVLMGESYLTVGAAVTIGPAVVTWGKDKSKTRHH